MRKLDTISKTYIQNIRVDDQLAVKFTEGSRRAVRNAISHSFFKDVHRLVFCNIEEMLMMHKSLVGELEADLANYPRYSMGSTLQKYVRVPLSCVFALTTRG